MEKIKTLIVGAGLTGLSAAYHLGSDYIILDKDTVVGGKSKTWRHSSGTHFDITGHWLHISHPYVKDLIFQLLDGKIKQIERKARIFSHNCYTRYPFQANTYGLPKEIIKDCLVGFFEAQLQKATHTTHNFKDWLLHTFGKGICDNFMFPYNEKFWQIDLAEITQNYASRYIPRPKIEDVIAGALGLSQEEMGYNAKFYYPEKGGIGAIANAFEKSLKIKTDCGVTLASIDILNKIAKIDNGRMIQYEHCISSIPLPLLIQKIHAPQNIQSCSDTLKSIYITYWDILVKNTSYQKEDYHWIYFPENQYPFHRVGSYSAADSDAVPSKEYRSYYVETSHLHRDSMKSSQSKILQALNDLGTLLKNDEIVEIRQSTIDQAYVIFDHHYAENREILLQYLKEHQIHSIGRYGGWQYNAMENSIMDGKRNADLINKQNKEIYEI